VTKSQLLIAIAILLLSVSVEGAEKITRETFESGGKKRTYYLYVPGSIGSKAAPLVVLLHGSGRNGLSLVETWKDLANREGIILAGPDASNTQSWRIPDDGPSLLHDLVETLRKKYPIDNQRVYLFGHSAGAVFALDMAMMESEYFAASSFHAGAWRDQGEYSMMDNATRKCPLAIFVGDRDQFFPLSSVKATEAALKDHGFAVELTVIKGHTHNYYDLASDINRQAWQFLKAHRLDQQPKYNDYGSPAGTGESATIAEINALTAKVNALLEAFYAKEDQLQKMDLSHDRTSSAALAREQITILTQSASAFRESARKAEQLSRSTTKGNSPQYFSTFSRQQLKRAEMVEAMRERAELLLSDQLSDDIKAKRNELREKIERLREEADDLGKKPDR
jgi:predicted esterase